jgi:O-antigen ligase/Tfp pilus assembly protein PilF
MAQHAPKNRKNNQQTADKQASTQQRNESLQKLPLLPFLALSAYLAVHFIPELGGIDVMGIQWLYISLLDLLLIGYILVNKQQYGPTITAILKNPYTKLYIALYLWAAFSIFFAINRVEAWVCYIRFTATIIAFINIGILFTRRIALFRMVARLISLILLFESLKYLSDFFNQLPTVPLDGLILKLNANTGNKNIYAASLAIKVPFVLYCLVNAKIGERILMLATLTLGITVIFMTSARASFVSLFLIAAGFLVFTIINFLQERKTEQMIFRLAYLLIPLVAGFFIAQAIFSQAGLYQDRNNSGYADVTSRISSISVTQDNSSYRLTLWKHAFSFIKEHPFMGAGYGNWKLASIPYVKEDINDLNVPAHAHNDFLEYFAELGIIGGCLFLALFAFLLVLTIKTIRNKHISHDIKLISFFSYLALLSYAVDSALNFPIERPIMQIFFAMVTAFNLGAYLQGQSEAIPDEETKGKSIAGLALPLYGLIALLILLPTSYLHYQTYQSYRAQMKVIPDMKNEPMLLPLSEVTQLFPSFPNLTTSSQPIDAIIGRYYSENKKFDEAKALLNKAIPQNPYIYYSHFLMANIFFQTNQLDSAKYYAGEAYYHRPRANTYYQTYMAVLSRVKDSTEIKKVFNTYRGYRNEPFAYDLYIRAMLQTYGKGTPSLLTLVDSAIQRFKPTSGNPSPEYLELEKRRKEIVDNMGVGGTTTSNVSQDALNTAIAIYNEGIIAFGKQDYATAAARFTKAASIAVINYSVYENAGVSYFNMKNYAKAVQYFDKAIAMNVAKDGKSEYFKGICHLNLGNKQKGCAALEISRSKGYPDAAGIIANYCK